METGCRQAAKLELETLERTNETLIHSKHICILHMCMHIYTYVCMYIYIYMMMMMMMMIIVIIMIMIISSPRIRSSRHSEDVMRHDYTINKQRKS